MMTVRSLRIGVLAATGWIAVYALIVSLLAGLPHLLDQVRRDGWLLGLLAAGFAVQVALLIELRGRRRRAAGTTGPVVVGAGVSTVGMVACCAHHVADLLPLVGAAGVASVVTTAQRPLMLLGLASTIGAIVILARSLRTVTSPASDVSTPDHERSPQWAP
jgi:predicted outer membrane lipoprotein